MRKTLSIVLLLVVSIFYANAQERKITGVVTDETGQGLPGVTVQLKGTTIGTITDFDGNYTISAASDAVIVYSFIGYLSQELQPGSRSQIDVSLELDVKQLEEVVVVGYGTMKKSDLTGAVTSVDAEDLAKVRSANVVEVMQGKAPGVDITRDGGRAGSGYSITIRGTRSISASNDPLYVVDGVPYGEQVNIDPNDIESIEILKDASSTAIYGSRGANGVVLITTKKGSQGKGQISFNMYSGITKRIGEIPLGDRDWFIQMYNDLRWVKDRQRDPSAPPDPQGWEKELRTNEKLALSLDSAADYDWYDLVLQDGSQQSYNLSFNGASDRLTYGASVSYYDEVGMIPNDRFQRYVLRLNLEGKINDYVSVGTSNVTSMIVNQRRGSPLGDARKLSPLAPPDTSGVLIAFPRFNEEVRNPLLTEDEDYYFRESRTGRVFNTFYVNVNMLDKALNFRSSINMDLDFDRDGEFTGVHPDINGVSEARVSNRIGTDYNFQNVINYDKQLGANHALKLTLGSELIYRRDERYQQYGRELGLENSQWYAMESAASNLSFAIGENQYPLTESKLASFFGRAHYSFLDRYMLQVTARYDGSSVLAEGNKWAFFPSASAAWRVSEEPFFPQQPVLTDLKVRAGIGVSGNQAVSAYSSRGRVSNVLFYEFGLNNTLLNSYRAVTTENRDLTWESTTALNIGVDYEFWQGRLSGAVEFYKTTTEDLLLDYTLPAHAGITSIIANVASTENTGMEFSLNANVINTNDFTWNSTITYYSNDEKITKIASGQQQDIANGWFVGHPVNVYYDQHFIGIWQKGEEDEAAAYDAVPGDMKFYDPTPEDSTAERVIRGTPRPDWIGGWTNNFTYKGFDLSIIAFTRQGHTIRDRVRSSFAPNGLTNSMKLDYWTYSNPSNTTPRLDPGRTQSGYTQLSTMEYTDGSFIKIRDITLGYSLPSSILDNAGITKLRVYLTVKNPLIWSKFGDYRGFGGRQDRNDPELNGSIDLPMPRMFAGGLNLTF